MGKLIDMTGQKFGRLLVLEQLPAVKRRAMWLCRWITIQAQQKNRRPKAVSKGAGYDD